MGTLTVRHEIHVSAGLDDVWRFIAEEYFDNHHRWDPAIVGMTNLTGGPVREGVGGVEVRRFLGKQRAAFDVTEFRQRERFALTNTSGPFRLERSYSLTPDGSGTTVVFSFEMTPKSVVNLVFPLVRRTIEQQVRANIDRLGGLLGDR